MATSKTKEESLLPNIVMVEMIGKLGSVKGLHGAIRPDMFTTKTRDSKEEGKPAGEYRSPVFMNTKKVLSPMWDNILNKWQFAGDYASFVRVVKGMGLRYPDGHPNGRGRIKVEALESHLRNRQDPVFQNKDVLGKFILQNGKATLRVNEEPFHEFLYHCFRASRLFVDETVEGKVTRHAGAKYRLTSTKRKNVVERKQADKYLAVMGLLNTITSDEPRLRAICGLSQLPGYSERTDVNGMVVLLLAQINDQPDRPVTAHGGKPFIEVLHYFMEKEASELKYEYDIMRALDMGIIQKAPGGINLQGVFLPGPTSFDQIVRFFQAEANQDHFYNLSVAIGNL